MSTETNSFKLEYEIIPMSKGELALEQRCHVDTIRRRFKALGIDTGFDKFLTIAHLKAYYDVYGKPTFVKNAG